MVQVEDPETIRYVGASYLNLVGLNPDYGRDMLKNQVRRPYQTCPLKGLSFGLAKHSRR